MRKGILWLVAVGLLGLLSAPASAQESVPLPVRKVVLYKNGMGYFEHLGRIRDAQVVEITLPSRQLNDVLKSLTVLDLGGGQVTGVTYDSTAPLARQLQELPVDLRKAGSLVGFLNQITGAGVEVKSPSGTVRGKIMGADVRVRTNGPGATTQVVEISIFTNTGEMRIVELESAGGLRFTDSAMASNIGRYLDLVNNENQRDIRNLKVQTAGRGERQLFVSYTAEAPIWKTTYRVVLDEGKPALLQGWAIVDNTTSMDWNGVELSLVAGAPVSFIHNLSQPVYGRRPVVPLPQGVQVTPQTHEGTFERPTGAATISGIVRDPTGAVIPGAEVQVFDVNGRRVGRATTDRRGEYRIAVPEGRYQVRAQSQGFQTMNYNNVLVNSGRIRSLDIPLEVGAVAETVMVESEAFDAVARGRLRRELAKSAAAEPVVGGGYGGGVFDVGDAIRQQGGADAQGRALGEQFEYKLGHPVTIGKNQSALLPILQAEVEAEKVSLYNASNGGRRPRLAVWLKNTSGATLDAGAFTVIDTNAFAGEGMTQTVQPGESRLLSYALDLGVEVTTNRGSERKRVERIVVNRGVLRMHRKVVEKHTYSIRNNADKVRTLVVEHPLRNGWKLVETPKPAESSANYHRFKLTAKPKATSEFVVREESPQQTTYALTNITAEQITLWVRGKDINPEIEKALRPIVEKKAEINDLNNKIKAREQEQNEIFRDQDRVRNNLSRLGRTPEEAQLRQRYIRQLERQETRIGALRAERDRLDTARLAAQKQLDDMLTNLSFDRTL